MKRLECTDYDSMGNHGRFPISKNTIKSKNKFQKLISWVYYFKKK